MIYVVETKSSKYPKISIEEAKNFLKNNEILGFDLETTGYFPQNSHILAAGFGNSENQIIVPGHLLSELKKEMLACTLIVQNLAFDFRFCLHIDIWLEKYYDTMIAEKVIYQGLKRHGYSYEDLVKRYVNITIDKSFQKKVAFSNIEDLQFQEYLAQDVKYLEIIMNNQKKILTEQNLNKTFFLIENPYIQNLAYSAYHGFKVNRKYLNELIDKRVKEQEDLINKMNQYIINNNIEEFIEYTSTDLFNESSKTVSINWKSSQQVIAVFKTIGIEVLAQNPTTKEFKPSSSYKLIGKHKNDLAKLFGKYGKLRKKLESFGFNIQILLQHFTDDRIRTSYNQIVDTGRISSGGKTFDKIKLINLQNVPTDKEDREIYEAGEGNSLIILDYSQQEPRLIASQSNDAKYAEYAINPEMDLHCFFAQFRFPELRELSHKEIAKLHSDKRTQCKAITFTFAYLGTAYTIHQRTGIPLIECEAVEKHYWEEFSNVKKFCDDCYNIAERTGKIIINNVTNRHRLLDFFEYYTQLKALLTKDFMAKYSEGKKNNNAFYLANKSKVSAFYKYQSKIKKLAVNTKIQGTGADMTKLAEILFLNELKREKLLGIVFIPNRVHDEIDIECPDNLIPKIQKIAESCMMKSAELFLQKHIPMKIGITVSKKWVK